MFTKTTLSVLSSLILFAPSVVEAALFQQLNAKLTFYYDIGDKGGCGNSPTDPVPKGWADSSGINAGVTYCEQQRGMSLNQIGTNRIVAFDQDKVWADPAQWCGREVKVYGPDGNELIMAEGPFYIWDSCQNCAGGGAILDVSGEAFVDANGGTCGGNNPTGYRYDVLDNYVIDPSEGLGGAAVGVGNGSSAGSDAAPTSTGEPSTLAEGTIAPSPVSIDNGSQASSVPIPITSAQTAQPSASSPVVSFGTASGTAGQASPTATSPSASAPTDVQPGNASSSTGVSGSNASGQYVSQGTHSSASPVSTGGSVAAIADSQSSVNTTSPGSTCRRRRKRRLHKFH
ncbi:uncharacterized protein L201_003878 [Kwoniella dendrophila CBS 6074]|uniref:Uncharacterized protein n=1 Tax=Kwoniella dendrophila CBS 6074 TaxID=1295534 RepID=A0AAX4JWR4_9TREE